MQVEKEPLISIIIPIYNVEAYLTKCIASVVRQIYSNIEIILVDDGSPDNCGKICDAWAEKDSRIVVIHKKMAVFPMHGMLALQRHQESM